MKLILITGLILISSMVFTIEKPVKKEQGTKNTYTGKIKHLKTFFETLYKQGQFNGMVLIAENGKPFFKESYGYSDFDKKTGFKSNSIFDIASISKTFTAVAIGMLKERGLLKYEDKVSKFLKDFPFKNITIRHLLTHSSGLPDFNQFFYQNWNRSKVANNSDLYRILLKKVSKLIFKPGEKWSYSNPNYTLLSMIVEKISKKDFPEFCKKNIFIPLKMKNTGILSYDETIKKKNYVEDYIYQFAKKWYINVGNYPDFDNVTFTADMYGAGGVSTSTTDLLKFDQALYSNILLKTENKKELFKPIKIKSNFGMGWFIDKDPLLGKSVYHPGGYGGYRSFFQRFIDKKITIIFFTNIDTPIYGIRNSIIQLLKGEKIVYPKLSGIKELNKIIDSKSKEEIITEFNKIKKNKTKYYINEFDFSFFSSDLFASDSYKKAEIIYELYAEYFPKSILAHEGLGDVYMKLKKKKLAIKSYKQALKLDPDNEELKKKISLNN